MYIKSALTVFKCVLNLCGGDKEGPRFDSRLGPLSVDFTRASPEMNW